MRLMTLPSTFKKELQSRRGIAELAAVAEDIVEYRRIVKKRREQAKSKSIGKHPSFIPSKNPLPMRTMSQTKLCNTAHQTQPIRYSP